MVIVGGVLMSGSDYLALANALAGDFEVHVMERRGRPGSGSQRDGHSLEDERADLIAVAEATGSRVVFGHSFGGLVALETARRPGLFDEVLVYEPGVPIRGQIRTGWLDDYQRRLERGDRRGAFARMAKGAGFAPRVVEIMPVWYLRLVMRMHLRGEKWEAIDRLLDANLVEARLQARLDAPSVERFSEITARTVLLGGARSPDSVSGPMLDELAAVIPLSEVEVFADLGHVAPQEHPDRVASAILAHLAPPSEGASKGRGGNGWVE
jgi:pimeloyl-ACP methyl ester carboxylesterase